jgi:cysteine-rich repeat protein
MNNKQLTTAIAYGALFIGVLLVANTGELKCSGGRCSFLAQTASSSAGLCGNGILDAREECDEGRFNGATNCSLTCTLLYCGDSVVSPQLGEQCEPTYTVVTVTDPITGTQVQEKHYDAPSCGMSCTIPICDGSGKCVGGCKRLFLPPCTSSSSVSVHSSSSTSSASSLLAASGSGQSLSSSSSAASSVVSSAASVVTMPAPFCGNTVLDKGEQCDDGTRNSDTRADSCRTNCTLPRCGDGVTDRGEECDDGNSVNNDNCSNECRLPRCGDGVVQRGEQCDDGTRNSDARPDSCRLDCVLSHCGDGVTDKGEQCDDGTRDSNTRADACRLDCVLSHCGDGVIDKGEQCDDGARNGAMADPCTADCRIVPRCGNGVIEPGEQCDDGNVVSGDGCAALCQIEPSFVCSGTPSMCIHVGGALPSSSSLSNSSEVFSSSSSSEAPPAVCGNGILETGEQCDDGTNNSNVLPDRCRMDCMFPRCGDGVTDNGEECDGGDQCTSTCSSFHAAASLLPTHWDRTVWIAILSVLEATVIGTFLFRKPLAHALVGWVHREVPPSIDEVPLSDIEMPGMKH